MENKVLTDITQIPNLLCNYIESLDYRRNLSPHSLRAYSSDLLQVFQMKEFGAIRGPKLGGETSYYWEVKQNLPEDGGIALKKRIQESVASWGKLAPKSRRRKFSALNSFIDWLKAEKKLEIPWLTPPSKTPPTKIPNFLSVDECMSLISYLEKPINDEAFHQQKLLFYLLYGCGLRVSEACGLLRENISFEKRQIRLW